VQVRLSRDRAYNSVPRARIAERHGRGSDHIAVVVLV
jgi:hypothetical protein